MTVTTELEKAGRQRSVMVGRWYEVVRQTVKKFFSLFAFPTAPRGAIPLFRFGSTLVTLHVSFALVILGAVWLGWYQYRSMSGILFNVIAVLLLFGCVLIHEIAHTFWARKVGVVVFDITLLPIGGVANMEQRPISPTDEVRIALAGPFANLLLGAVFTGMVLVAAVLDQISLLRFVVDGLRQPSVVGLISYLAAANLILGLFNLLPALPLDGGRALRALLCRRMSYEKATQVAAIIGRSCGAGLLAIAGAMLLFGWLPYSVTLAIVALILYSEATRELRAVRAQSALRKWTVGQLAHAAKHIVTPNQPLASVLSAITNGQIIPVVVGEQSKLVGLVTSADVRGRTGRIVDLNIAHVMRTKFPTVTVNDPLWIAHEKLKQSNLYAIPVVYDDSLLNGLITLADIRQALRENRERQQGT